MTTSRSAPSGRKDSGYTGQLSFTGKTCAWGHENRETSLIGGKYWVWGFEECVRLCLFLADPLGQVQFPHLHLVGKSISLADSLKG